MLLRVATLMEKEQKKAEQIEKDVKRAKEAKLLLKMKNLKN